MKHISASVVPCGQNLKTLKFSFVTYKSCCAQHPGKVGQADLINPDIKKVGL